MWAYISVLIMYVGVLLLSVLIFPLALVAFYWVPPLMFRAMNPNDTFVRNHAANAVNATLTNLIASGIGLIGILLLLTGHVVTVLLGVLIILGCVAYYIGVFTCLVRGMIRASNGQPYVFPWITIRFVKQERD